MHYEKRGKNYGFTDYNYISTLFYLSMIPVQLQSVYILLNDFDGYACVCTNFSMLMSWNCIG